MSWTKLLAEQRIHPHKTSKQEISSLRKLVERDLKDAALAGLSPDRKFATAYNAVLQLSKMAIACAGYRTSSSAAGHHQTTFEAAKLSIGSSSFKLTDYFETCRRMRNTIDYDYAEVVTDAQAKELSEKAEEFLNCIENWIAVNHPNLGR